VNATWKTSAPCACSATGEKLLRCAFGSLERSLASRDSSRDHSRDHRCKSGSSCPIDRSSRCCSNSHSKTVRSSRRRNNTEYCSIRKHRRDSHTCHDCLPGVRRGRGRLRGIRAQKIRAVRRSIRVGHQSIPAVRRRTIASHLHFHAIHFHVIQRSFAHPTNRDFHPSGSHRRRRDAGQM
jgi:hypothetical protein